MVWHFNMSLLVKKMEFEGLTLYYYSSKIFDLNMMIASMLIQNLKHHHLEATLFKIIPLMVWMCRTYVVNINDQIEPTNLLEVLPLALSPRLFLCSKAYFSFLFQSYAFPNHSKFVG